MRLRRRRKSGSEFPTDRICMGATEFTGLLGESMLSCACYGGTSEKDGGTLPQKRERTNGSARRVPIAEAYWIGIWERELNRSDVSSAAGFVPTLARFLARAGENAGR